MSDKRHCEKHGDFEVRKVEILGRKISRTHCPACSAELEVERENENRERLRLHEVRRWEAKIGNACIPDRFVNRTLESYCANTPGKRKALDFAKSFADGFEGNHGQSAVFLGKPGTGKTHLSVGIALQIMVAGHSALFMTVMRAIRRIKDTWTRGSEMSETEAIESLVFPELLVLDEVGVQFGSDTEKLLLFEILNERYERRRPTLLLSNLDINEVKAYLGERVFDRLREDGGKVIVFDWESYRSGKAEIMAVAA